MLNSYQLKELSNKLTDKLEALLKHFKIKFTKDNKRYIFACPIHEGDNEQACNIYYTGDNYRGNWVCNTNHCEKRYINSILGFIRGTLTTKLERKVEFPEVLKFAENFLQEKVSAIKVDVKKVEKESFGRLVDIIQEREVAVISEREKIITNLNIPAQYYIKRGYSKEILVKYDVGLCTNPSKEMFQRAVFPIYDDSYKYLIGCTGRSINPACPKCKLHHYEKYDCPTKCQGLYSKWRHSSDFKGAENLFNFWFAKPHIKSSIILVESPGNVLRLEEAGIRNSVATFGSQLQPLQKLKIDCTPATNIITIMDNDDAGNIARDQIYKVCTKTHNIIHIIPKKNDLGEMSVDEVLQEIVPGIKDYVR